MNLFDEQALKILSRVLKRSKQTIAVAESVTSGLLQTAISQSECAADFFLGGITAYNLSQKYRHLRVDPVHAKQTNCVSERVAMEMALHVCELFGSDWGIGITGYATPVSESGNELFAYYAIACKSEIIYKGIMEPSKDDPFRVQLHYVNTILRALVRQLS